MRVVYADPNVKVEPLTKNEAAAACLNVVSTVAGRGSRTAAAQNTITVFNNLFGEERVTQLNKDLINTIGAPVFAEILRKDTFNADNFTVGDTKKILSNMKIENTNNELLSSLQLKKPDEYVTEDNKLHLLAYVSTLIGKCMTADATISATNTLNQPIHFDISGRRPELNEPKKPNWFVRTFSFLSKSWQEQVNTYKNEMQEYTAHKDSITAERNKYDEANAINNHSSTVYANKRSHERATRAERTHVPREDILGTQNVKTTQKQEPQMETQKAKTAGPR